MVDRRPAEMATPIEGPTSTATVPEVDTPGRPRLARRQIELTDGHEVGLAVSGRGIPLVVVHGFSAEGFLYAQTLSRLVGMGYRVIAIDTAGHGGTHGLPRTGADMADYAGLLRRVLDELGIKRAVLAGHSMGGRIVTELAAVAPHRVIALLLLDAIVGRAWDRIVSLARRFPPALAVTGVSLAVDTLSTMPVFRDPRQAVKLMRLVFPTGTATFLRPWRLLGPTVSILRSGGSDEILERIREEQVPLFALHGDRDYGVPLATARDAARRTRGTLVVVKGASHSWVLKDPETLPAIVYDLLGGALGAVQRQALLDAGVAPGASLDEVEAALYEPGAPILHLTPEIDTPAGSPHHGPVPADPDLNPHSPRYDWELVDFSGEEPSG
jgi:pimeloyl-ACP methyl ester carboxylesterase